MKSIIIVLLFLLAVECFASEFSCPTKQVKTKQSIVQQSSGWKVFQDPNDIHILKSVDFYDGTPKKMIQLAPDNADSGQDPVWSFGQKHEIWQVCRYTNTKVSLTKKLSPGLKSCAVKYSKSVSPQIDSIDCK